MLQRVGDFLGIGGATKKIARQAEKLGKRAVHTLDKAATSVASNPAFMIALPGISLATHGISKATGGKGVFKGALGRMVDTGTGAALAAVPAGSIAASAGKTGQTAMKAFDSAKSAYKTANKAVKAAQSPFAALAGKQTAIVKTRASIAPGLLAGVRKAAQPPGPAKPKAHVPTSTPKPAKAPSRAALSLAGKTFGDAIKLTTKNAALKSPKAPIKAAMFGTQVMPRATIGLTSKPPVKAAPSSAPSSAPASSKGAQEGMLVRRDGTIDFESQHWVRA